MLPLNSSPQMLSNRLISVSWRTPVNGVLNRISIKNVLPSATSISFIPSTGSSGRSYNSLSLVSLSNKYNNRFINRFDIRTLSNGGDSGDSGDDKDNDNNDDSNEGPSSSELNDPTKNPSTIRTSNLLPGDQAPNPSTLTAALVSVLKAVKSPSNGTKVRRWVERRTGATRQQYTVYLY